MPRVLLALVLSAILGLAMLVLPACADAAAGQGGAGGATQAEMSARDGTAVEVAPVELLKRCIVGKSGIGGVSNCPGAKAMPSDAGLSGAGGAPCIPAAAAEAWPPGIEPEPPRSPPRPDRI